MADTVIPTIMDIAGDHGWPGGEMPKTVIEALCVLAGYIGGGDVDPAVIEAAVRDWLDDHHEATTTVADGSVTTKKLADGAVSTAKLSTSAVTNDKLENLAVTTDKISSSAKAELTSAILYATDATTAQTLAALGFAATVLTPKNARSTTDAYGLPPHTSIRSMLCWIDTTSGYLEKAPLGFSGNLQSQAITLWAKGLHSMATGTLGVDTSWTITALPTDADGVSY